MSSLLPLAIAVPLTGATLSLLVIGSRRAQRAISIICGSATAAISLAALIEVDRNGTAVSSIGNWPAEIAINLVADRFAALMLTISTTMLLAVLLYAIGQAGDDERSRSYHPAYTLTAGVCGAFLAGDLFNLFVWFEVLLIASYVLLTLEGTDQQIRAGTTYVVLNVIESFVLVTGVALIFAATGTLNMAVLPERLADLPDGIRLGLNLLLLIAFGLKAAVFPLFSWLPDSYPAARSPISAVFAGLLTKIGVYAIIRTQTLLFPGTLRTLLLVIAGLTMVVGVLGAIAQSDMKRILSFHIVSQIGYMIMGLALGGVAAITATIFYMLHRVPVKTSLFLVEGIVERETGSSELGRVSGLARRSGPMAALFLIPALSLAGLPPFSGFLGKTAVVTEGLDQRSWWIVAAALAVSLHDARVDAQDLERRLLGPGGSGLRQRSGHRHPPEPQADGGRDDDRGRCDAADRGVRRAAVPPRRAAPQTTSPTGSPTRRRCSGEPTTLAAVRAGGVARPLGRGHGRERGQRRRRRRDHRAGPPTGALTPHPASGRARAPVGRLRVAARLVIGDGRGHGPGAHAGPPAIRRGRGRAGASLAVGRDDRRGCDQPHPRHPDPRLPLPRRRSREWGSAGVVRPRSRVDGPGPHPRRRVASRATRRVGDHPRRRRRDARRRPEGGFDVTVVGWMSGVMLGAAGLLATVHVIRSRDLVDRAVGVDMLIAIILNSLAATIAITQDDLVAALVLIIGLLAFLGSVTIARYIEERGP